MICLGRQTIGSIIVIQSSEQRFTHPRGELGAQSSREPTSSSLRDGKDRTESGSTEEAGSTMAKYGKKYILGRGL